MGVTCTATMAAGLKLCYHPVRMSNKHIKFRFEVGTEPPSSSGRTMMVSNRRGHFSHQKGVRRCSLSVFVLGSVADVPMVRLGERVLVVGQRTGVVRFYGKTSFAPGRTLGHVPNCTLCPLKLFCPSGFVHLQHNNI